MRDTIFVSHVNPQDYTFALWLSLKLTSVGYGVPPVGAADVADVVENATESKGVLCDES